VKGLRKPPTRTATEVDPQAVLDELLAAPKMQVAYCIAHDEAERVNTWVRAHSRYGMSQLAVRDIDGELVGYRLRLNEMIKKRKPK
jgi:hypothetical protein